MWAHQQDRAKSSRIRVRFNVRFLKLLMISQ